MTDQEQHAKFGLDKTRIEDILQDVLATLLQMPTFELEWPGAERRKLSSLADDRIANTG